MIPEFMYFVMIVVGVFTWQAAVNRKHYKRIEELQNEIHKLHEKLLIAEDKQADCERREKIWAHRHNIVLQKYYKLLELNQKLVLDKLDDNAYNENIDKNSTVKGTDNGSKVATNISKSD